MKHGMRVTLILLLVFMIAQATGLFLINQDLEVSEVDGVTVIEHSETAVGPRPDLTGAGTFIYLLFGVAIGTALILLIIKFKKVKLWKLWFFLAAWIAMTLALGVVTSVAYATTIALILAIIKVFKPNILIHNLTEILMYAGVAVFLVPTLDVFWAAIMLVAFSGYDVYAVWKSKHMVKMAEFQTKSKMFAGLTIPYAGKKIKLKASNLPLPSKTKKHPKESSVRTAILGGGDIAFPLLFTGAVMEWLVLSGLPKLTALYQSFIVTLTTTLALFALFMLAEKEKFYPAMPFVTVGCFIGFGILLLI